MQRTHEFLEEKSEARMWLVMLVLLLVLLALIVSSYAYANDLMPIS
jgi:hypothetical protein